MTREEMATTCAGLAAAADKSNGIVAIAVGERKELLAAAAELRKTCATCQHFNRESSTVAFCLHDKVMQRVMYSTPPDGSGFCHRHEEKK